MDQGAQKDQSNKNIIDFEMLDHVITNILSDLGVEIQSKSNNLNDSLISVLKTDHTAHDFEERIFRLTSLLEVLTDLFSL